MIQTVIRRDKGTRLAVGTGNEGCTSSRTRMSIDDNASNIRNVHFSHTARLRMPQGSQSSPYKDIVCDRC